MFTKAVGSKNGVVLPMSPLFCTEGFTWSAVWLCPGAFSEVLDALTVNGVPVYPLNIPLTCHPLSATLLIGFALAQRPPVPKGRWATHAARNVCVRSYPAGA